MRRKSDPFDDITDNAGHIALFNSDLDKVNRALATLDDLNMPYDAEPAQAALQALAQKLQSYIDVYTRAEQRQRDSQSLFDRIGEPKSAPGAHSRYR
jgi:hypothetical protein